MPSTRDIRRRIKSVKNTAQITKAMQMVAASKMRRAQELALSGRPFAETLCKVLRSVSARVDDIQHALGERREVKTTCVLLISTNKGLCGGLNTNLFREASLLPKDTVFVNAGRKGKQFLARLQRNLLADFELGEQVSFAESKHISKFLIDGFIGRKFDAVQVLYPSFVNTLVQKPKLVPLLPLKSLSEIEEDLDHYSGKDTSQDPSSNLEYLYEPSAAAVFEHLLPRYVHLEVYHMILEARASEHSARMVAMKSATDNAKQLQKDLTLEYNKVRQASITNEILEISAAQMAAN
jgi:F-type H+-transporting ATPase subunit gamma